MHDIQHILMGERLKVEAIRGVIIRAHGFWIAVHHDRIDRFFPKRHGCMDTAVVELDALSDTIRSSTKNDDLLSIRRPCFALVAIGGIEIRRLSLELCGTGIHSFIGHAPFPMFHACLRNHPGFTAQQVSNTIIRKAEFLGIPEESSAQTLNRIGRMADKNSFKIH